MIAEITAPAAVNRNPNPRECAENACMGSAEEMKTASLRVRGVW